MTGRESEVFTHLNNATFCTSIPHSNVNESNCAPDIRSDRGKSGSSMVFSWTWKENRKNDSDEDSRAHGNIGSVGVETSSRLPAEVRLFLEPAGGTVTCRSLVPAMMRLNELGRNPIAVRPVDILRSIDCESQKRHLMMTFDAHQKLATLSSNKPRPKGKMRVIGSRIAEEGAKGGRKGRKTSTKAATVVNPIRTKWFRL